MLKYLFNLPEKIKLTLKFFKIKRNFINLYYANIIKQINSLKNIRDYLKKII
jgi:hypothetical protein